MFLFVDKTTGKPLAAGAGWREPSSYQAELATILANNPGHAEGDLLAYEVSDRDRASALLARLPDLTATVEGGVVTALNPPPEPNQVWLHVELTGGDGENPPGIQNDGADALAITATLRTSADPASPKIEIDGAWRVAIRDDTGAIYDVVKVAMTAGVVSASYATTARPAECELLESDFDPVTAGGKTYTVRLAGPAGWKVYRNL